MTKTRIKKTVIEEVTHEEAVQAFAELAAADAETKRITAEMDLEMTKIRMIYQDDLEANAKIVREKFDLLQAFLKLHPEVLGDKRSVELTHGTIGYRLGQPALKTLKGFTWGACKKLVTEFISEDYIREKTEIDKESLLANRDRLVTEVLIYDETDPIWQTPEEDRPSFSSLFEKCGFKVEQDDTFYVVPKKEEALQTTL